jgi:hypothetical protein
LFFNFALEYAIRSVQVNQDGLKLNGTHRFLIYPVYVNKLGVRVFNVKKNTEVLVVDSIGIGLEADADKN